MCYFLEENQVLKTWFLFCRNRVFKTRDLCGASMQLNKCKASGKWISKTQVLYRSRVSKTRDAIFLNPLKRALTYYIVDPYTASSQIPSLYVFFSFCEAVGFQKKKKKNKEKEKNWYQKKITVYY